MTPTPPQAGERAEALLPCICGAVVDQDECPYPAAVDNDSRAVWRVNCSNPNCGWEAIGWGKDGARKAWNSRGAAEADARRYRWLAENAVIETSTWRHDGKDPASTKLPLDNAIDAAIAALDSEESK